MNLKSADKNLDLRLLLRLSAMFVGGFLIWIAINSCGKSERITDVDDPAARMIRIDYTHRLWTVGSEEERIRKMLKYGPKSVHLNPGIERVSEGEGYRLRLDWSIEGAEPTTWEVVFYSDRDDGVNEMVFRDHQLQKTPHYLSPLLKRNRRYKLEVIGIVERRVPGDEFFEEMVYADVFIDLTEKKP